MVGKLGIPVRTLDSVEEVVRSADLAIGGTTRTDIVSREPWVKRGATFVSLARREMDPAGWAKFDKVVIDDWDCNMGVRDFRAMLDAGEFRREQLHADIGEVVAGLKPGRERDDERILVHTTGMVSHDIGIAWSIFQKARRAGPRRAAADRCCAGAIRAEGLRALCARRRDTLSAHGRGWGDRMSKKTERVRTPSPSFASLSRPLPWRGERFTPPPRARAPSSVRTAGSNS